MKRLFLLRHGEAGTADNKHDKSRKLTPKGTADAMALGRYMADRGFTPDFVLCSSATRTQQTAAQVLRTFDHSITMSCEDALYNAPRGKLLSRIQDIDNIYHAVLVVAHNPGIFELCITLAEQGADSVTRRLLSSGFMPGTLCVLECPCGEWGTIQPSENVLLDLATPQDYNAPATPARWT